MKMICLLIVQQLELLNNLLKHMLTSKVTAQDLDFRTGTAGAGIC